MVGETVSEVGTLFIAHDVREALNHGTFDLPGHHLSLNEFSVDEEGWAELGAIYEWALAETLSVGDAVRSRGGGIPIAAALLLFQLGGVG